MKSISVWEWAVILVVPVAILGSVFLFILWFAYSTVSAEDFLVFFTTPARNNHSVPVSLFSTATSTPFQPLPSSTNTVTMVPPTQTPLPSATLTFTPTWTPIASFTPSLTPSEPPRVEPTFVYARETPAPEPTKAPPLPKSAAISNIVGHAQFSNLDCEARSAVDFAAYFGVKINEKEFLSRLPKSDDPNEGFVGNVNDPRGHLPPQSYGVYAQPVAALLHDYGLSVRARKNFSWEKIQTEIAAGRPVIAWVIGNTIAGRPVQYTPSNGNTTVVAAYEHTVIVTGYDREYVTVLDGYLVYQRSIPTFLDSWGVLENMVVIAK